MAVETFVAIIVILTTGTVGRRKKKDGIGFDRSGGLSSNDDLGAYRAHFDVTSDGQYSKDDVASSHVSCLDGEAYHNGTMVNDNATAWNTKECSQRCTDDPNCYFWDFQPVTSFGIGGFCRLRADSGSGAEPAVGFQGGPKNCVLKTCSAPRLYSASLEEKQIIGPLLEPLVSDQMGTGHDVKKEGREKYNTLIPRAIWKVHPENELLKAYSSRRDLLNKIHNNKSYWVPTARNDVQERARAAGLTTPNEYLLLRGDSTPEKLLTRFCEGYTLPAPDFPNSFLSNIFGHGRYFCDASDKADQYSFRVSNLSFLGDLVNVEDEQLQALQDAQHDLFLMAVSRVYLGRHGEVALMNLDCWEHVDKANQSRLWFYRDGETQNDYYVYDRPGNRFNTTPPFGVWELAEWDSIKAMGYLFEQNFSSDWIPALRGAPSRHNEYVIPDAQYAAIEYIVAYERHWEEGKPGGPRRSPGVNACDADFQLPESVGRNHNLIKIQGTR